MESTQEKITNLENAKAQLKWCAQNGKGLRVLGKPDGRGGYNDWRKTLAGTWYAIIRFGYFAVYRNSSIAYELHVHGGSGARAKLNDQNVDAKVCGQGLKGGELRLSSAEWTEIKTSIKALLP